MSLTNRPNIIFLDMDGVLCNARACIAVGNNSTYTYLDPIACLLVKRLCTENNARLVISSSWRNSHNKASFQALLNAACPGLGELVWDDERWWKTASMVASNEWLETSDRGLEIADWVGWNRLSFNNFIILDDMADMRPVQDNLVRCSTYDGIGFFQYEEAGKILQHPFSD
jgi:hypothetical protein